MKLGNTGIALLSEKNMGSRNTILWEIEILLIKQIKKMAGEAVVRHCLNTCFPIVLDFGRDWGNTFA